MSEPDDDGRQKPPQGPTPKPKKDDPSPKPGGKPGIPRPGWPAELEVDEEPALDDVVDGIVGGGGSGKGGDW